MIKNKDGKWDGEKKRKLKTDNVMQRQVFGENLMYITEIG